MKPDSFALPVWRSEDERLGAGTQHSPHEFPELDRRELMKLLGATAALGAASCARPPSEVMLPYQSIPDGLTASDAQHYATVLTMGSHVTPVVATAREGRPLKLEGANGAGLGPLEQAQILTLYDPLRAQHVTHRGQPSSKRAFLEFVAGLPRESRVCFLGEPFGSPLLDSLRARIRERLPQARFLSWSAVSAANRYEGARLAFGRPLEPLYDFAKAKVILSLDADFLSATGPLEHVRAWASRRQPGSDMSRLYVAEPSLTVTGSVADHRLRTRGSDIEGLARALLEPGSTYDGWLGAVRADLAAARHEALIVVGNRQPAVVHALAHALHDALGVLGTTVRLVEPSMDPRSGPEVLAELRTGKFDAVVVTAWNPVFTTFADVDLARLNLVYLGAYNDETAAASTWFVPRQHALESWGDAKALDGTVHLQQPLIEPLFRETMSEVSLLAAFAGIEKPERELLKSLWWERTPATDFDVVWNRWLQAGRIDGTASPGVAPELKLRELPPAKPPLEGIELAFAEDAKLHDGRGAAATWLLELPDPVTKLSWDNAALMSPKTAAALGLKPGLDGVASWSRRSPMVSLTVHGAHVTSALQVPVFVLPGHADDCITLPLGWSGEHGFNAFRLRHSAAPSFTRVAVEPLTDTFDLVTTQEHWTMEGRQIALHANLEGLTRLKAQLEPLNAPLPTVQQPYDYSRADYRWGMAIDLNVCTGCSACVTACQAENNIPVVGKEAVWRNREMFWIRVDRYFIGDSDEPQVITQPVTCQQCETAPCEYVCPVEATSHSDEGLNDQVYNRCIGTRYCENNCPYKVRRFNYFDFRGNLKPLQQLAMNPDVTVRRRGVMEKCTFCIQRIERARIAARRVEQRIADGTLQTACQQACPTRAISFGALNDEGSEVARKHRDVRRYELLHELGTRPRNAYLVRIKNPNPELA